MIRWHAWRNIAARPDHVIAIRDGNAVVVLIDVDAMVMGTSRMSRRRGSVLSGSCLCGAVVFEADAHAGVITFCNCRNCRKASGTAFAANMSVPRNGFRWVKGEDALRGYHARR